jgi:AcrR family transcriptional regulator
VRDQRGDAGGRPEKLLGRGFNRTSLGDLVEATGLAKPSLYGAFGDKHTMYVRAFRRLLRCRRREMSTSDPPELFDELRAAPSRPASPKAPVARTVESYLSGADAFDH